MVNVRMLRYDEPLAVELTAILKQGDIERLSPLLAADPAYVAPGGALALGRKQR
jgi:hypothetical protein